MKELAIIILRLLDSQERLAKDNFLQCVVISEQEDEIKKLKEDNKFLHSKIGKLEADLEAYDNYRDTKGS